MKKEKEESFNEMVDRLAGYALTELVTGKVSWRTIMHGVCMDAHRIGYDKGYEKAKDEAAEEAAGASM